MCSLGKTWVALCLTGVYIQHAMRDFIIQHLSHVVALLTILSRLADIGTTYLVTPKLALEANSIVRRLGWKYAMVTVLAGLVPYFSIAIGIVILSASFFVASSNAGRILTAKALGEDELVRLHQRIILAAPPRLGWLYFIMPAFLFSIPGWVLLFFYPNPEEWAFYFAEGIIVYAFAIAFWSAVRYRRIRKDSNPTAPPISSP